MRILRLPVSQQRLLMGETEQTAATWWSDLSGLRNWAVVQLTVVEVCRSALSPLLTLSFMVFPSVVSAVSILYVNKYLHTHHARRTLAADTTNEIHLIVIAGFY